MHIPVPDSILQLKRQYRIRFNNWSLTRKNKFRKIRRLSSEFEFKAQPLDANSPRRKHYYARAETTP